MVMTNKGSEFRKSVLPELPARKNTSDLSLPMTGKIKRQNDVTMRNFPLSPSKSQLIDYSALSKSRTQRPFNQLALSLMGVRRSLASKSSLDKKQSFDIKKSSF